MSTSHLSPLPELRPETVRRATHRALEARARLVSEYPEWEHWRRQVRELKARALALWEDNLARLRRAVTAWGGEVLWARDAAQARVQILALTRRHGVRQVVKSKSMTTEELGLTPALVAAGLEVTETDLGEFIVQLAGHPPAHLTAPALHLNRLDIARLFARHLGYALPAAPAELCAAAARHLAPRFGAARMGITGVNAATPDGTLVFLENEGNLRRTACIPPVHVAVMGIEKLLPGLTDLEVLLRLLPASATGQRLTALVHLKRGLTTGPSGTQAFYLLLLDNGRRRLGEHPELREALFCLRCGACLNICPVFQAGGAHLYGRVYPGAIGILLAPFLPPEGDLPDLCTQCGACGDICPAAIPLPELILNLRRSSRRFRRLRRLAGALSHLLCHPGVYRRGERLWRRLGRFLPSPAPPPAPESFRALWRQAREPSPPGGPFRTPPRIPAPGASAPHRPPPPPAPARFAEAGCGYVSLRGPEALAAYLRERRQGPLFVEDHPWLAPVVRELEALGVPARLAAGTWAPEADTVVTVGLAAVPETGSVLVAPPSEPALWLPFQACRQVVVVPQQESDLSLARSLALAAARPEPWVSWLTGPTRTADIEKVLVLGAQGPAALDVVAYDPGL
ncbi:MAG: LUD domain-containing protein [Syntrophobacterales bacterium]|nr:LUD domain-containing protein [Syntrophobacterales bacterium]